MDTPKMQTCISCTTHLSVTTAQRWMKRISYRWTRDPKGQFVDGHEHADVIAYQQQVFLLKWSQLKTKLQDWTNADQANPPTHKQHTVLWFHDKSTFYANNWQKIRWCHKDENVVPYAKGEGASQMVSDFISADYGWLCSPCELEEARQLFKAGKNQDGYFTNNDIVEQAERAMDILEKYFPHDDHVLVYDNASTHLKHTDGALSAHHMPKNISKPESNWGIEVNVWDESGKPVYGSDGKLLKMKVCMEDAILMDRTPQPLYFPPGHPKAGLFKGMSVILAE
jgi:hypothetical protein